MTDMASFGYNNRWVRLAKDLVFAAIGFFFLWKGGFLMSLVGGFALIWYGYDAYNQAKVLWQEKHFVPGGETNPSPKAPSDNGRISVSTDAKEVDYEKE
jgi:hypothetical protein